MRARRIDILKGILTIQMIFAHCIQFYVDLGENQTALHISEYINLITFSGFLFCFGYASCLAYFGRKWGEAAGRLIKNALRLMAGFYISSFCYVIFVEKIAYRMDVVLDILLLRRLAGWSEFLFSFALVMILECIFFPLFTEKYRWGLPVLTVVSIVVCLLPHKEAGSITGSLIGGTGGAYFPVIPYGVYLLAGVWFARTRTGFKKVILALAFAGTLWHTIDYMWILGQQPSRFPLSFSYLIGAALFVYLYYLFAVLLEKKTEALPVRYLADVGKNSLFYLLLSNLIIFAVTATKFYKKGMGYSIGLCIVILILLGYLREQCKKKESPKN